MSVREGGKGKVEKYRFDPCSLSPFFHGHPLTILNHSAWNLSSRDFFSPGSLLNQKWQLHL